MIKLFKNGKIKTMDTELPEVESFIVEDNKFLFMGSEIDCENYLKTKGPADEEIDLKGNLVIPGLNDSHMHFIHFAKGLLSVNLVGTKTIDEIKMRMKERIDSRDKDDISWIEGEGWNHDYFQDEKRFPNKFDLDQVSIDVPMLVMRTCFHIGVLNTPAMKLLGIDKDTAGNYGDLLEVSIDGEPNGVIKESLLDDVKAKISTLTFESTKDIIVKAQVEAFKEGLTSVQSDDFGYVPNYDYDFLFKVLKDLDEAGDLKIRIGEQCLFTDKEKLEEFFQKGYKPGWGNERYNMTCVKILSDGSLGARTAALRQPYKDDPSTRGLSMFSQEDLDEMVLISHKNNCPVAIHAIGDGAMEMSLIAIERAQKTYPKISLRHGIVHCQVTDEELLEKFKDLDVLAFVQPIFIDYDMNIINERVGEELANSSYAWKTMIKKGIHVSFGTDCPVEPPSTMPNIYSAVTRKNITGDKKRMFLENEKITMKEAIYAYTAEGAYASGEEELKGSISPGKLADFIVLDTDLFNLKDEEDILETRVVKTYIDGELVYSK